MFKSKAKKEEIKKQKDELLTQAQDLYYQQRELLEALRVFNLQEAYQEPDVERVPESSKLQDYILQSQERILELKARNEKEGRKALTEAETKLENSLEKIEAERLNFHQFDLARYRQYLKLLKLTAHYQKTLQTIRYYLQLPHITPFDTDAFYSEAYRLGKNKKVVDEAAEEALGAYIGRTNKTAVLNSIQRKLLSEYFESQVLLVLPSPSGKEENEPKGSDWKAFQVEDNSNLYLVPVMLLGDDPWPRATEVVSAQGLSEDQIKIIVTLYGGEAYPTLKDSIDGAKAI